MEQHCAISSEVEEELQQSEMEFNQEAAHAEHWRVQHEREIEELERVKAQLTLIEDRTREVQHTARGTEKAGAAFVGLRAQMLAAVKSRNEAESRLLSKQREEEACS